MVCSKSADPACEMTRRLRCRLCARSALRTESLPKSYYRCLLHSTAERSEAFELPAWGVGGTGGGRGGILRGGTPNPPPPATPTPAPSNGTCFLEGLQKNIRRDPPSQNRTNLKHLIQFCSIWHRFHVCCIIGALICRASFMLCFLHSF